MPDAIRHRRTVGRQTWLCWRWEGVRVPGRTGVHRASDLRTDSECAMSSGLCAVRDRVVCVLPVPCARVRLQATRTYWGCGACRALLGHGGALL